MELNLNIRRLEKLKKLIIEDLQNLLKIEKLDPILLNDIYETIEMNFQYMIDIEKMRYNSEDSDDDIFNI